MTSPQLSGKVAPSHGLGLMIDRVLMIYGALMICPEITVQRR